MRVPVVLYVLHDAAQHERRATEPKHTIFAHMEGREGRKASASTQKQRRRSDNDGYVRLGIRRQKLVWTIVLVLDAVVVVAILVPA